MSPVVWASAALARVFAEVISVSTIVPAGPVKRLIVIEHNHFRIKKAKKLGADFVINPDTQDVVSSINKISF